MSALFIILVGLTMTLFSYKMLISHRCIHGLIPNLVKKSWMVSNQAGVTRKAHPLKAVMTALFENFFLAASYALFMVQGFTLCTVYQFWKNLLKFLAFYSIFRHQFTFEMLKYVNVLGLIEICSFRRIFF